MAALPRSALQVAALAAPCAVVAAVLALLEKDGGSSFYVNFVGYFHPLLSLAVAVAVAVLVFKRRVQDQGLIIVMAVLLALMAASPKRVTFSLYPYTTLLLLALLTWAFVSLSRADQTPKNPGGR